MKGPIFILTLSMLFFSGCLVCVCVSVCVCVCVCVHFVNLHHFYQYYLGGQQLFGIFGASFVFREKQRAAGNVIIL